ncbi:MAG: methionyl-tRNA formyltransferase [Acidimicrobiales bacterium]|nr:MAG: methionyl-tRNA formyltransferase [Acidimicrobiales bacterium]
MRIVVTRPDKRRSRGGRPVPTPVGEFAREAGLKVVHSVREAVDEGCDLGVVVAYGEILKPDVLKRIPFVNLHYSLLPRWRGAAPVQHAILAGDSITGVCLMQITEGLDEGGIYDCATVPIGERDTTETLTERLTDLGLELLDRALRVGFGEPRPQVGEATYAPRLEPDDLRVDWREPSEMIVRKVRVGGAWTTWRGRRLKLVEVAGCREGSTSLEPGELSEVFVGTGDVPVRLVRVKEEGRREVRAEDWVRGARPMRGERFE